jgi:hypothetical protein
MKCGGCGKELGVFYKLKRLFSYKKYALLVVTDSDDKDKVLSSAYLCKECTVFYSLVKLLLDEFGEEAVISALNDYNMEED